MRHIRHRLEGFLAGLVLSAAVAAGGASAARPAPEPFVPGFVDVGVAMRGSDALREMDARLRADRDAGLSSLAERAKRLEARKSELDLLTIGTSAWRTLAREIRIEEFAIETDRQDLARDVDERARRAHASVYRGLNEAARAVAEKRGFSAVLDASQAASPGAGAADSPERPLFRLVLWHDGSRDVTRDVVEEMNAD
jgi:Skp family chaperone for outer membrane proteins